MTALWSSIDQARVYAIADEAVAALAVCRATTTTTTTTTNTDDGSAAGVGECFIASGDCASCCGGCVKTVIPDNSAMTGSCVCYEADTKPSAIFRGTNNNDCVFIKADNVEFVRVRNQCLEGARRKFSPGETRHSSRRGEEDDTRDALRACGRDSDLISPTS